MTDLAELLERVRKATGPDRELDGEIAATLRVGNKLPDWAQNWTGEWRPTIQGFVVLMQDDEQPGPNFSSPKFTASIDAALALVERVLPGWKVSLFIGHMTAAKNGDGARAELIAPGKPKKISASEWRWPKVAACYHAQTPALAIVTALLSALIAREPAQ